MTVGQVGTSAEELVRAGATLLSEYLREPRTSLLRQLAPIIVDLRARFTLEDGRQDWAGRSPEYRAIMADLYARAGVQKEQRDTIQAAMRYHIGNLLRERATTDELLSVGLTPTSPKDRNAAAREAFQALSATAGGKTPRRDIDRLAVYAQALLQFIDETAIPSLEEERARVSQMALEAVRERASELLRYLSTASAPRQRRRGGRGLAALGRGDGAEPH